MPDRAALNYDALGVEHYTWGHLQDLQSAPDPRDGIHTIGSGSDRIDLLTLNDALLGDHDHILVVFNGAVTGRPEKTGPFFSGRGLARMSGLPAVCIADTAVSDHDNLGLAWYRGEARSTVVATTDRVIDWLSTRARYGTILVGGSGGGFAALDFGSACPTSTTVIAWNPQVDILEYAPKFVQSFLRSTQRAGPGEDGGPLWKDVARATFETEALRTNLAAQALDLNPANRFLVLQNSSDWHVKRHLAPLIRSGQPSRVTPGGIDWGQDKIFRLRDYGSGHIPPPSSEVLSLIQAVAVRPEVPLDQVWGDLLTLGAVHEHETTSFPKWLTESVDYLEGLLAFEIDDHHRLVPRLAGSPDTPRSVLTFSYSLRQDQREISSAVGHLGSPFPLGDQPWTHVQVQVSDGFGNVLVTRTVERRNAV